MFGAFFQKKDNTVEGFVRHVLCCAEIVNLGVSLGVALKYPVHELDVSRGMK